jgi:hypothetical protein
MIKMNNEKNISMETGIERINQTNLLARKTLEEANA